MSKNITRRLGASLTWGTALLSILSSASANAAHRKPMAQHASFDLTPYYGEHVCQCSGSGVLDPRDEQQTFIIKPGEIEVRGHNFGYSKLKSTSKGATRSSAYYFVTVDSNTTLVFENDRLTSATMVGVTPDSTGQAMKIRTDCTFN